MYDPYEFGASLNHIELGYLLATGNIQAYLSTQVSLHPSEMLGEHHAVVVLRPMCERPCSLQA